MQDALSQKNIKANEHSNENVLSYPLKEAREKFEKVLFDFTVKKSIKAIYLKQQNLLVWKDQLFIEN